MSLQDIKYAKELAEKQREQVRLQEEYNEAIKMSTSLSNILQTDIENTVNTTSALSEKGKTYLNDLKSSVSQLSSSEDISKKLVNIAAERTKLQSNSLGFNQTETDAIIQQLDAAERVLNIEEQKVLATEKVNEAAKKLSETMGGAFDGLVDGVRQIPLIGKALGELGDMGTKILKQKLANAAMKFTTDFREGLDNDLGMMGSLRAAAPALGKSFVAAFASPLVIIGLLVAALGLGLKRFSEIDKAAGQFRDTTGLLNSQTKGLQSTISSVSVEYANLGATAEDVGKAASSFVTAFDGIQQPAKSTVESLIVMNKNFGVGFDEASKVNKVMQNMGGLTEAQAASMSMSVVEMSKLAGVAPQQVMKDIADNSANALKYFRGSPKELAKSAVSLAAMGSSLESAAKSSEALLDFESSIANELEASALLGADINLEKARAAAFAGDQYGQEKAIMEQMMKVGDISKMDMYRKDALAKATGKTVEELINMQRIQTQFGNLDEGRLAAAHALLDTGKDISQVTEADLDAQTQRMAKEKEMQSVMDDLSNKVSALGTGLSDAFLPLAQVAIPMIGNLIDNISGVLVPLFSSLGTILKVVLKPLGFMLSIIGSIGKAVINFIVTPIKFVADIIGSVYDLFSALATDGISGLVSKIQELGPLMSGIAVTVGIIASAFLLSIVPSIIAFGATLLTTVVPALFSAVASTITWAISMAAAAVAAIASASALTLGIGALAIAGGIAAGAMAMKSGTESATPSIDDGVVQNGNVITTDPADFLIATKNPSALAGQLGGGDGGATAALVSSLIAEMQGMRADLAAGKIAVNIDGQRMNAKIAANAVRNPIS